MNLLVTAVIPTFRRPGRVAVAVRSALENSQVVSEVLVIDDNLDDDYKRQTKDALRAFNDSRIRIVDNKRRKGGCGARNTGILEARNELIAFLDDDDLFIPGQLKLQVDEIAGDKNVDVMCGAAEVIDEVYGRRRYTDLSVETLDFESLIRGKCPCSTSVVIARRSVLLRVGLFDEDLPSFQDYDLWLRIAFEKYVIKCNRNVVARFVQHSEDRTSINLQRRLDGLELLRKKWETELRRYHAWDRFWRSHAAAAYAQNARLLMAAGLSNRMRAIGYFALAALLAPSRRPKRWIAVVASLAGYHVCRAALLLTDNIRNRRLNRPGFPR